MLVKLFLVCESTIPIVAVNSYAMIKPPFEIPAYELNESTADENDQRVFKFDGYGVVRNVGTIKEIKVETLGRNFPHNLFCCDRERNRRRAIHQNGKSGVFWLEIIDLAEPELPRRCAKPTTNALSPLYPQNEPFIKIKGILDSPG
jgi:hypothetical protein